MWKLAGVIFACWLALVIHVIYWSNAHTPRDVIAVIALPPYCGKAPIALAFCMLTYKQAWMFGLTNVRRLVDFSLDDPSNYTVKDSY